MLPLRQYGLRLYSNSAATSTTKAGKLLDSIIRVNHAGELAADRIYAGQMAVLGIGKLFEKLYCIVGFSLFFYHNACCFNHYLKQAILQRVR